MAACRRAWQLRKPYLALHLLASVLGAVILTPLVAVLARLAALVSGAPAVADQDIARLALSPAGLLALVLLIAVLLVVNAVGVSAMMTLDAARQRGAVMTAPMALLALLPRLLSVLHVAVRVVLALLLRALPFALAGLLIARLLLGDADINYYLTERPPAFFWAAGLGVLLLAGLVWVLGRCLLAWSLALPAVVIGGAHPAAALRESEATTSGDRQRLAAVFLLGLLAALMLTALASTVTGGAARLLAPAPDASLHNIAVHVLLSLSVLSVVNLFTGAAITSSFASLLVRLHEAAGGEASAPAPAALPPRALPIAVLLGAAAIAGAIGGGLTLAAGLRADEAVTVIGHRGVGSRPENTLPAIEQAIAEGADWIEIDVQESADGAVVVVHDSDFMKLAGVGVSVFEATLAEIEAIDVGARFDPAYVGTRVPTLDAVLAAAKGRARVLIELKHYGHAQQLEARVAAIVEAADMVDDIAIMSLDHASAARMKALRPDWQVGLLAATALGDLARLETDFLAVSTHLASAGLIGRAGQAGRDVYVWTVNDPVSMSRAVSLGAAGLITDNPGQARAVLEERADLSDAERLALLAADLFGVGNQISDDNAP